MTSPAGRRMASRINRGTVGGLAVASLLLLSLSACGGSSDSTADAAATEAASAPAASAAATGEAVAAALGADEWVSNVGDFKDAADWDTAEVLTLDVAAAMTPAVLELVAGMPYEIQITNSGSADQGISAVDFYKASAVRKTESGAEIKMYQFSDIYAAAGSTVSLFVVPVMPGTYPLVGVDAAGAPVDGLTGSVNVTGAVPTAPAPVIEPLSSLGVPAGAADMITAAIPTWDTDATAVTITMGDQEGAEGTGFFKPENTDLKVGVPATITFTNEGTVMHVYEIEDLLKASASWKVTASDGFTTGAQIRPADVEAGISTSLYLIPMTAGTYTLTDSAPGMETTTATITVTE
ncbi:MAG: Copper-bind protein [Actinomycetota bacterium]|nr:Copper-bind protein [Actinomycetota bacterium]